MRRAAAVLALACAACSTGPRRSAVDDARRADEEAFAANSTAIDVPANVRHWVVLEKGGVVASASLPEDAVRAAEAKSPAPAHRFVFRPRDVGTPLYRLVFVAEGGIVAGRRFLADLGLEATGAPGAPPVLRKKAGGGSLDLGPSRRLAVNVASLDGSVRRTIDAVFDPDFDGGLLVPLGLAAALRLERAEIPGGADVQVALARPFRGHRATVVAAVPALGVGGPAEVVYEDTSYRK